jgi:GT2 family glycosyltransferase
MMDPETFLYSEEAILSERMKLIGKRIYYYPSVAVLHEHGNTTKKLFDKFKVRQLKFESDSYYYRKYIGTPGWQFRLAKITYWLKGLIGR